MNKVKMNNDGFTLLEMIICFALLGILLVAAGQIISSSTQVYYYTKSTSYGIQASQIVATEIRGELEEALPQQLTNDSTKAGELGISSFNNPTNAKNYFIYIKDDRSGIAFVNEKGNTVVYSLSSIESVINQNIGMGYKIIGMDFSLFEKTNVSTETNELPGNSIVNNYPIIKLDITVNNPQYGDYSCTEYIPLYNFYGLNEERISELIHTN